MANLRVTTDPAPGEVKKLVVFYDDGTSDVGGMNFIIPPFIFAPNSANIH
jgi:hypothetical protein